MNKTTITIEELDNGKLRVAVDGPPYIANGRNLSSRDITPHWLSDFAPGEGQAREEYASQHCAEEAHWHGPEGACDGMCHELNCGEPADFFVHWKAEDGREHCVPFCKWHTHFTADLVGAAVLNALQFGVADDLRFWRDVDTLPDGRPRCDRIYRAIDEWGDSEKARCTRPAAKQVRVTRFGDGPYEVQWCDACAKTEEELENAQRSPIAAAPAPEPPGNPQAQGSTMTLAEFLDAVPVPERQKRE